MADRNLIRGGCHCGMVMLEFETGVPPTELSPWACDCSFCLKHGASYIADRNGVLRIEAKVPETISEYRQGSQTARFLFCRRCGVLVAALFDAESGQCAAINARCFDENVVFGAPQPVSPKQLSVEQKKRQWAKLWIADVKLAISSA